MCASVHADFCRPKGLESAQTRPSTYSVWNHRGYHKLSVWEKLSIEYIKCIHIRTLLTLAMSHRVMTPFTLALSHWVTTQSY